MSAPRPDPRYASASRPINLRTAPREAPAVPPQVHASVRQRLQSTHARQLLGTPLHRQLGQPPLQTGPRRPASRRHAVLGLAPMVALVGAWLAWPPSTPTALAAGGLLVAGGLGAAAWALVDGHRARQARAGSAAPVAPAFDMQALVRLDAVLEELAPLAPPATLVQLGELKATLVRVAPLLATAPVNELFTLDDRLYMAEAVRRYLPDSLQGWLQVPAHLRDTPGDGDGDEALSAQALLDRQLTLLQAELHQRERKLGRGAAAKLLQQQRFLAAKHRGG
ncbi:MAG: hypothetical protein EOP81_09765 [Variovorax sp.]|nr:MAG: hypothetical protein EOP81_09765 [Variovorax sp.]